MTRLPVPALALTVVLAACGGAASSDDLGPLADQADQVAQLIDDGRDCEAVDALADLRSLAEQDVPTDVRDAVVAFTSSAEQSVTCPPPATEVPSSEPPVEPQGDEARPEDEGRGEGTDEDGDRPGKGKGRDKGDDSDD